MLAGGIDVTLQWQQPDGRSLVYPESCGKQLGSNRAAGTHGLFASLKRSLLDMTVGLLFQRSAESVQGDCAVFIAANMQFDALAM